MAQDGNPSQPPAHDDAPHPVTWRGRFGRFFFTTNRVLTYAKGLPVITLIGSLLVGYFQYLSAYQDKVSAQAKDDMTEATSTFLEISNSFSKAQTLQQILFFDFAAALDNKTDGNAQALETADAQKIYPDYQDARNTLRQNSDLLARKAELYLDSASDFARDPAETRTPSTDPLDQSLLGAYNFDCDDPNNRPDFAKAERSIQSGVPAKPLEASCPVDKNQWNNDPPGTFVDLCARTDDGKIVPDKHAITLHWYSAKHQLLAMHYCFQILHSRLLAARDWASKSELSPALKAKFAAERADTQQQLDNQVMRLNSFMNLAMFQMDNIRVKYRPVGFACHIPFVSPVIGLFSRYCTPIRTAPVRRD
jgi:hypothetical protein